MARASLIPSNGALTLAGYAMDFASFDITSQQAVENVTPYGSNTCTKNVGNGTPDFSFNAGAFAQKGVSNSALAMPVLAAAGVAAVFTLDTGCTESCTAILESLRVSHARMRAAVPVALSLKNAGDVTEAYVVT